jgi:hypothetical protein
MNCTAVPRFVRAVNAIPVPLTLEPWMGLP